MVKIVMLPIQTILEFLDTPESRHAAVNNPRKTKLHMNQSIKTKMKLEETDIFNNS